MSYSIGQAILGKVRFKDGTMPQYKRPYLIVDIKENRIGIITVSSTRGKYQKMLLESNMLINRFNPPFVESSFVKLDSLQYFSEEELVNCQVMSGGKGLNSVEINNITKKLKSDYVMS